jgi:hypothetical protein
LGRPYDGIENLRPESKAAVEAFLLKQSTPKKLGDKGSGNREKGIGVRDW